MPPPAELPRLDPFAENFQQFPFAALTLLRERAPVHALAEPGWYIVTTMELAREVLTDPARFSNQVSRRTPPPLQVADEVAAIRSRGFPSVPTPPPRPSARSWHPSGGLRWSVICSTTSCRSPVNSSGDGTSPATICSACSWPPLPTRGRARSPSEPPSW